LSPDSQSSLAARPGPETDRPDDGHIAAATVNPFAAKSGTRYARPDTITLAAPRGSAREPPAAGSTQCTSGPSFLAKAEKGHACRPARLVLGGSRRRRFCGIVTVKQVSGAYSTVGSCENLRFERGGIFVNGTRQDDGAIELGTGGEMRFSPFEAIAQRQGTPITWATS
jgi:hypothetical protein